MTGRELAAALIAANRITLDDAADELLLTMDGREIIDRFLRRRDVFWRGHPPAARMKHTVQRTRRKKAKADA